MIRTLRVGDFLQFERRGYYKVDSITSQENGEFFYEIIYVPDGKKKGLASISRQSDTQGGIVKLDLAEKIENKKNKEKKGEKQTEGAEGAEKK